MIDENAFDRLASDTLKKLERTLTDLDPRLEADLAADVLTLEFDDGKTFVVNSHRAARQIWVSALLSAWHFSYDEVSGRWIDTREGRELGELLSTVIGKKLGKPLTLSLG